MREIKKIKVDERGFFVIDAVIAAAFIASAAGLWFFLGMAAQAQQQRAQHVAAVFLAQRYLNEIEYGIIKAAREESAESESISAELEDSRLTYNECDFVVKKRLTQNSEYNYTINVAVEWSCNDERQTENWQRTITVY